MSVAQGVASTDGVTVALHDLGGDGPPLLLCHATGFHGYVWAPLAAELADVARCWAPDLRGHGDSSLPATGDVAWHGIVDDVLAVVDHLGANGHRRGGGLRAVGHSMGGAVLLLAEQARPGTFDGLWLFEPIVFRPLEGEIPANPIAEAARRRRPWFPDRDAAYANYATKPPLATLTPAALRAYVDHGFRDVPESGTVTLKCTPDTEARVFEAGLATDTFSRLGEVQAEVTVAASGDGRPPAQVARLVAEALPRGRLESHPRLSHFGPLEDQAPIAAAIRHALHLG